MESIIIQINFKIGQIHNVFSTSYKKECVDSNNICDNIQYLICPLNYLISVNDLNHHLYIKNDYDFFNDEEVLKQSDESYWVFELKSKHIFISTDEDLFNSVVRKNLNRYKMTKYYCHDTVEILNIHKY